METVRARAGSWSLRLACAAAVCSFTGVARAQLTLIPATAPQTTANSNAISADGTTVVGNGFSPATAFRWRASTGKYDLGNETGFGGRASVAYGVSANGNVVVGVSNVAPNDYGHAFRWSGPGTRQDLGVLPSWSQSTATAVSGDGSVVVGYCSPPVDNVRGAFRWTAQTGMQPIPNMSWAGAISRDGSTVVGYRGTSFLTPSIWSQQTGTVPLTLPPDHTIGVAEGVNYDGSIIVGQAAINTTAAAVIWRSGIPTSVGIPEGWLSSNLVAVSDNGSIAVGYVRGNDSNPFGAVWTEARGMEPIQDFLNSQGIAFPSGTRFFGVTGISADGRTIAGSCLVPGQRLSGFVMQIPAPASAALLGVLGVLRRRRA